MARGGGGRGRGRLRKGQTRMDAAIDAMKPYGYSEELVVSTVNELLDVYGVEGWPFIEEASYTVLLDCIFEKDDKQTNENVKVRESETKAPAAGSTVTQESASEATKVPELAKSAEASEQNNAEGEGSSTSTEQDQDKNQTSDPQLTEHRSCSAAAAKNSQCCPPQLGISSEKAFPIRSCGPYHGWISDSDEPLDLIELKPARLTTLAPTGKRRRWDQLPQHIGAL